MNFLANENFPVPSIEYLRSCGHSVYRAADEYPSIPDEEVIRMARIASLVILTLDKDYGELVFKRKIHDPPPIVFFRFPSDIAPDLLGKIFEKHYREDNLVLDGNFIVIEEGQIRQHAYEKVQV